MKVIPRQTTVMQSGSILDPADVNRAYLDAQTALRDVVSKREQRSALVLPFCEDTATPYTQATATEARTYRFACPVPLRLERAELAANMTASGAVSVTCSTVGGIIPSGLSNPLLSTLGAVPLSTAGESLVPVTDYVTATGGVTTDTVDVSDYNPDRGLLEANTEYRFALSGTGTYSIARGDVVLWLTADRFQPSAADAAPVFTPTLVTDASQPSIAAFNTTTAALDAAAGGLASALVAPVPFFFVRHNVTSATSANLLTFPLPRFDSRRAQGRAIALYLWAVADAASTATVTATLKNNSSTTLASAVATFASATSASASTTGLSVSLVSATTGIVGNASSDYSVVVSTTSGANLKKIYGILWLSR